MATWKKTTPLTEGVHMVSTLEVDENETFLITRGQLLRLMVDAGYMPEEFAGVDPE